VFQTRWHDRQDGRDELNQQDEQVERDETDPQSERRRLGTLRTGRHSESPHVPNRSLTSPRCQRFRTPPVWSRRSCPSSTATRTSRLQIKCQSARQTATDRQRPRANPSAYSSTPSYRWHDGNASHNTLHGIAPRDTGEGVHSGNFLRLDDAGTRACAPNVRVVLANVNLDYGKTSGKRQRTQSLPNRAPNHRRAAAWGAAALGVWAAGPVTPPSAGAGCPHMPTHAHARWLTRPNKPPRQLPLSRVPDALKSPTGNGRPAQSHTATNSGRNMQSPLPSGAAERLISHAIGPSKSLAGDWREGGISTGTGHPAPGCKHSHVQNGAQVFPRHSVSHCTI